MKGVMRFSKRGKLSPRYVGPIEILELVGEGTCRLALPSSCGRVYNVFHVSMLIKCKHDNANVLRIEEPDIQEDLTYVDHLTHIMK